MQALESHVITTSPGGLVYAGDWVNGTLNTQMQHLACFSGGMFALGAEGSSNPEHYMKLGADLTHTCHESYDRSRQFHAIKFTNDVYINLNNFNN